MSGNSWVTLATNDSYSLGALVLARSLKRVGTAHNLTVLVTPGVSAAMRNQLASVFNIVEEVNILDSKDERNLALLTRPDLGVTFTKLHCWRLTQFSKCVFLDADVLVLQNCDELFDREELSAAPDVGWPDCFNSGVFVYRPSLETYNALINFALAQGSFDGGDQGLLNLFFSDWATKDISRHLPFIYNMCSTATYSYLPAFKQFGQNVKIVHFIGPAKPWLQYLDSETRQVRPSMGSEHLQGLLQLWWDIFCNDIHSTLSSEMAGLAGALSQLTLGVARSPEQIALEEHLRKQSWEHGNIDYMGRDSFDNIWRKICQTLAEAPSANPLPEQSSPSSQVSSVVVENISQGVTPADDTPQLSETISVASACKDSNDVTLSSADVGPTLEKSDVFTDDIVSGTVPIPSLKNISHSVQTDLTLEPIPTAEPSVPLSATPTPIISESQSNSLENKDAIHSKEISQSTIEVESSLPVVPQQAIGFQEEFHTNKQKCLIDSGEKIEIGEKAVPEQISIGDEPSARNIPSEPVILTVGISALEDDTKIITSVVSKQGSEAVEETKCVPFESSETQSSEFASLKSPKIPDERVELQVQTAQIPADIETLPTEISERVETSDFTSTSHGLTESVSDPLSHKQNVTVIGPTPPTTPIDGLVVAPCAAPTADTLSVDPSIPDTPPVGTETIPDSNTDATSTTLGPASISVNPDSAESSSPLVDPKAPIPPKRRHKSSQNLDQSGNKSGKAPNKSPKGKK